MKALSCSSSSLFALTLRYSQSSGDRMETRVVLESAQGERHQRLPSNASAKLQTDQSLGYPVSSGKSCELKLTEQMSSKSHCH